MSRKSKPHRVFLRWVRRCKHSTIVPKAEHYVHLTYFALVALSGPYYVAAGACFILGVTIVILEGGNGGH